ncbi:LOW QUALITY PROTEIN: endothelin-converting enzyme 2 [Drosophila albomicans]|uniref:LOW QUALITY PROTEIN: endothelin-converting enzyme 2 n=1 Tax=Drosophila albomicans TaxID=7291 RepID=A0A9C6TBD5_DROAB|nr:LOW QUALITY PROTEIN: endothelin-converting enzyme 2 [Drosophila albomicans]
MDAGPPNTRNRIWTTGSTNNGFFDENLQQQPLPLQRLQTPANRNLLSGHSNGNAIGHAESAQSKHLPYQPIGSNLIGVQSKFRRSYYHKVVLGGLALLVILLLITIIVISITLKKSSNICRSKECIRTAASLIYAMDEQTDPCKDFYKFTCGRWADEHPRPDSATSNDWFRERQSHIMRVVREFLKSNISSEEPEAVGMAKTVYKACMNTDLLDQRNLEPLVAYLQRFKLLLLPSAFNLTFSSSSRYAMESTNVSFNWLDSIVAIKRHLSMDLIIGFDVFPDPFNRTLNRIALGTPETESAFPFNNDDSHKMLRKIHKRTIFMENLDEDEDPDNRENEEEEAAKQTGSGMSAYLLYVRKVIEKYLLYVDPDVNQDEATVGITELVKQAVQVARKIHMLKEEAENITKPSKNPADDIVYISLLQLQNQTDKKIAPQTLPIWLRYMSLILEGTKHATKMETGNTTIITSQADIFYLQSIVEYLQETPAPYIESYLWLSAVEELVLHTTSDMRLLHAEYMRLVIGTEGSTPRSLYCAHGVNSLFGMAVSYVLADEQFTRQTLPRVERMLSDIRRSFDRLVRGTSWMDAATKRQTMLKSAEMKSFIGFPPWLTNASALNAYYEGVKVNASTHLENLMGFVHWQMLGRINDMDEPEPIGWATSPSNVNAFHTFQSNAITVPIAILQYPFYDLGLEALNYGSIGTILGHELTHGFDDSGRRFDRFGNMVEWWSNQTINEYVNRTDCFVDQYSHYYLSDIGEYIDGELTLGENIADNGGMREAFLAYRLYVKEVGRERLKLPGLEHYTHEQLFFIAFGNLWCETYTPAASRYALEDSHCPGQFRLKGVLTNSEEFARTFKCAAGSPMNPGQPRCRIW